MSRSETVHDRRTTRLCYQIRFLFAKARQAFLRSVFDPQMERFSTVKSAKAASLCRFPPVRIVVALSYVKVPPFL